MRRGFTLIELAVALAVGGVAFGAFTAVVAQQERTHAALAHRIHARSQALEGLAPLALELRALSPAAGDIVAASDSAIELRATLGSASVCESRQDAIVTALASFVSAPKTGDTVWTLSGGDSSRWLPIPLRAVSTVPRDDPVGCGAPPSAPGASPNGLSSRERYLLGLGQPPAESIFIGAPLRFTRRIRYSLYRAPDRHWYLGRREWSASLGRFETIQPVSGPYRQHANLGSGLSGFELRYRDSVGDEIEPVGSALSRVACIEVTVRTRPPPFDSLARRRRDLTALSIAPRNRT